MGGDLARRIDDRLAAWMRDQQLGSAPVKRLVLELAALVAARAALIGSVGPATPGEATAAPRLGNR
jgi:hypothetical protein